MKGNQCRSRHPRFLSDDPRGSVSGAGWLSHSQIPHGIRTLLEDKHCFDNKECFVWVGGHLLAPIQSNPTHGTNPLTAPQCCIFWALRDSPQISLSSTSLEIRVHPFHSSLNVRWDAEKASCYLTISPFLTNWQKPSKSDFWRTVQLMTIKPNNALLDIECFQYEWCNVWLSLKANTFLVMYLWSRVCSDKVVGSPANSNSQHV